MHRGGSRATVIKDRGKPMTIAIHKFVLLLLLSTIAAIPDARAQSWPSKPVTLMVPFAPGGTTDIVARPFAQALSVEFGQPFVVENRAGAGGTLAANLAAHAPADGYTLLVATVAHTMATSLYKSLPYDFEKDFVPITVLASVPNILIVNPSVPAKSVQELIAYAKANPGKLAYGSAGNGSTEHLSAELFKAMTGVDMVHIPYKGGAPMMTDLIGGQIQVAIETSGSAAPYIQSGKVRALAVTTPVRSPAFPDVPTLVESGLRSYDVTTWYAVLAPRGTPAEITNRLYNAIVKILKTPDMKQRLEQFGAEPGGMTPDQFAGFIKSETAKWTKVVKDSKATVD
jgi:tripartite-type tricarboxylate transporter receptor subunit TctC